MVTDPGILEIQFLDCGRGDTILIRFPDGSVGMVDCCFDRDKARSDLLPYLEDFRQGKPFRFLCLSHPHEDHYKGMSVVLEKFGDLIEAFWHSGTHMRVVFETVLAGFTLKEDFERSGANELFDIYALRRRLVRAHGRPRVVNLEEETALCDLGGVRVHALSPGASEWRAYLLDVGQLRAGLRTRAPDRNRISNSLLLRYGPSSIILGGDALELVWRWLGVRDLVHSSPDTVSFIILKAPHHGSDSAFSPPFYERCSRSGVECHVVVCGRSKEQAREECRRLLDFSWQKRLHLYFVARGQMRGLPNVEPQVAQSLADSSKPTQEPGGGGIHARVWPDGALVVGPL